MALAEEHFGRVVELHCRLIWVCVPMCLLGVLLTAQPSALFGSSSAGSSISLTGVAVGVLQVSLPLCDLYISAVLMCILPPCVLQPLSFNPQRLKGPLCSENIVHIAASLGDFSRTQALSTLTAV